MTVSTGRRVLTIARNVVIAAIAAVLALVVSSLPLYVFPAASTPSNSDAVMVLGPARDRLPTAIELMDAGYSDTLVIVSLIMPNGRFETDLCNDSDSVAYTVICFTPDPGTTRGEARTLRDLADEYGWDSVMVVTFTPHITRARVILERCFDGELRMIEYRPNFAFGDWVYHSVYQYGAFAKVFSEDGC